MYIPKYFAIEDKSKVQEMIRRYNFAAMTSYDGQKPYCTHLPFLLDAQNNCLFGHMAASNPHCQLLQKNSEVMVIFNGPHGYISPEWYSQTENVPTWNYLAVHVYGILEFITDQSKLVEIMRTTVEQTESANNTSWQFDSAPQDYMNALFKAIKAFKINIQSIEAKAKMSQNRQVDDIQSVVKNLSEIGNIEMAELISEFNGQRLK